MVDYRDSDAYRSERAEVARYIGPECWPEILVNTRDRYQQLAAGAHESLNRKEWDDPLRRTWREYASKCLAVHDHCMELLAAREIAKTLQVGAAPAITHAVPANASKLKPAPLHANT